MLYHAQPIKFRNFHRCVISNRGYTCCWKQSSEHSRRVSDASMMMRCVSSLCRVEIVVWLIFESTIDLSVTRCALSIIRASILIIQRRSETGQRGEWMGNLIGIRAFAIVNDSIQRGGGMHDLFVEEIIYISYYNYCFL